MIGLAYASVPLYRLFCQVTGFGGTVACTAPSPAHQVCLDLAPDAASAWTLEPPGFHVHAWSGPGRFVTHVAAIGDFDGPHGFTG